MQKPLDPGDELHSRRERPRLRVFSRRLAPAILLALTVATSFVAGWAWHTNGSVWSGLLFAICLLAAIGAHALGHYMVARRNGIDASFPYFVPQPGIVGTSGAFVKMSWPIEDRRVLARIFVAGPIAGFVVSTTVLTAAFCFSETIQEQQTGDFLRFGDSLLTLGLQRILFPGMAENEEVLLHPVGLAGYAGLGFNAWHLFPAGRLDGGRVVYALFGYRRALIVSWVTIAVLMALGYFSAAWPGLGIFAALTLIRLQRQHPVEQDAHPVDRTTISCVLAMFAILVLTFVPVPVRTAP